MKKLIALALAGTMVFAMPVMAAPSPSAGSSSPSASTVAVPAAPAAVAATPAPTVAAGEAPAYVVAAAQAEGKTVGEYMNNAVVSVPGLENVTPLGQGGHVIINGAPSNQVFSVLKPAAASVASAKAFAASLGGRVMNVAQIKASVSGFNTATVNFYMKGVTAGQNIKVYQLVNGQWVELTVAEIRADHVVVDMTSLGTLAFIAL
ncbi:MAG: hypothetical protein NC416_03905 [Eubacterium sp.]|nr:hypothetical protein [Eubacterium sp.]